MDQQALTELVRTYHSRSTPTIVVGDQVMVAVQLRPGVDGLDGNQLPAFLATQGDLGTKWAPRLT